MNMKLLSLSNSYPGVFVGTAHELLTLVTDVSRWRIQ